MKPNKRESTQNLIKRFDKLGYFYQKVDKANGSYILVCQNSAIIQFIQTEIQNSRQDFLEETEKLIVDEILICHETNTPTSRLTSLSTRINKLK